MRIANVDGRAVLLTTDTSGIDVAVASAGKFGPRLPSIYDDWDSFRAWAEEQTDLPADAYFRRDQLGSPSPAPRQIVAIGLNYSAHAAESGFEAPTGLPPTFTKFVSSLAGPDCARGAPARRQHRLGGRARRRHRPDRQQGRRGRRLGARRRCRGGPGHLRARLAAGRSRSTVQPGQVVPDFAPVGPWLVTPDSFPDRDDLALGCSVDGETVQDGRTRDLIVPVARLVAELSHTLTLFPGDIVFTGTPAGVGVGRTPQRFLQPGETLVSWIEGIGELHQTFVEDGATS